MSPRRIPPNALERLVATGEEAPDLATRVALAAEIRSFLGERTDELDRFLLERVLRLQRSLTEVRQLQLEIQSRIEGLADAPWHPATFRRRVEMPQGPRALVSLGGTRRVVAVDEGVALDDLRAGEEVFLDKESRLILARADGGLAPATEVCTVEERVSSTRVAARWRDEELLIDLAHPLHDVDLAVGDRLRWDPSLGMAFESLGRRESRRYFVERVPDLGRETVGGQEANLDLLIGALTAALVDPSAAARYGLTGRSSVLMIGPPGTGKTLMARVAASELQRLGGPTSFAVVKPGEWESEWVGATQAKIRETFSALRTAAREGQVVLFLDEIEAIGRQRGVSRHSDKFLAALLAELDGFESRDRIAVIAATNRKDLCDGALLERIGDIELVVGRPDRVGAKRILQIHLPEDVAYAPGAETRDDLIESACARLYDPNGDNRICALTLRDGTERTVVARELLSGRNLAQLCEDARRTALLRDVAGGPRGVSAEDVHGAISNLLQRLSTMLAPGNCHAHLTDVPPDADVVRVERLRNRAPRVHSLVHAA